MACNGLKMGSLHFFRHPNWCRIIFGKTHFSSIFDPFFVSKQPIFKAFWDFRRAKAGHHKLKTCQTHLFWHSVWSTIVLKISWFFFLHPVDLVDPFWHPPVWATSCNLPQPTRPKNGGLGVGWVVAGGLGAIEIVF